MGEAASSRQERIIRAHNKQPLRMGEGGTPLENNGRFTFAGASASVRKDPNSPAHRGMRVLQRCPFQTDGVAKPPVPSAEKARRDQGRRTSSRGRDPLLDRLTN